MAEHLTQPTAATRCVPHERYLNPNRTLKPPGNKDTARPSLRDNHLIQPLAHWRCSEMLPYQVNEKLCTQGLRDMWHFPIISISICSINKLYSNVFPMFLHELSLQQRHLEFLRGRNTQVESSVRYRDTD